MIGPWAEQLHDTDLALAAEGCRGTLSAACRLGIGIRRSGKPQLLNLRFVEQSDNARQLCCLGLLCRVENKSLTILRSEHDRAKA